MPTDPQQPASPESPRMSDLTIQEISLLLYLETVMVDHRGRVDQSHLNDDDRKIVKRWNKIGFICFGRICARDMTPKGTSWVTLSDEAWRLAHEHRRARAERCQKIRGYLTIDEFKKEKA